MKHTKKKIDNGWKYRDYDITKVKKKWSCDNKPFDTLGKAQKYIDSLLDVQKIEKIEQTTEICPEIEQTISLVDLMKIFIEEYDLPNSYILYKDRGDRVAIRYRNMLGHRDRFEKLRDDLKPITDYGKEYGYECFFRVTLYPDNDFFLTIINDQCNK